MALPIGGRLISSVFFLFVIDISYIPWYSICNQLIVLNTGGAYVTI